MRRSASFKDILIDLIEENQEWFEALDPEYIDGGSSKAEEKYEALHSGDLETAISLTDNRILKKVLRKIKSEMDALSPRRSASEIITNLEDRIARLENQNPKSRIARLEKSSQQKESTSKRANAIAATIVNQLGGGRKLQMFIGLKQLINEPLGVTLVFPKPKHAGAVNRVRITLNGMDLYDMEFIRTRGSSVKVVKEFNDVYAEDIKDRFEEGTGLYIRF